MYAGLGIHNPRHPTNRDTPPPSPPLPTLIRSGDSSFIPAGSRVNNSGEGEGKKGTRGFEILLRCGYTGESESYAVPTN